MTRHTRAGHHAPASAAGSAGEQAAGDLQPRVRVGRLDSVAAWRREIGRVYRAMRRGEMASDLGARLTYVGNVAAQLVKVEEELRHQAQIIAELERARSTSLNGHTPAISFEPAPSEPAVGLGDVAQ